MLTPAFVESFSREWIAAWNSHDLDRVLSHYTDDFVMSSPHIAVIANEPSGVLHSKAAVRAYWSRALELFPDLHFELIEAFAGSNSVALYYRGVRGPAVEVFFFDHDGRVVQAAAHYRP